MKFPSIIKAEDLLNLNQENLVIVDAGSGKAAYESYLQKHLEGALYVDLNEDLAEIPIDAKNGGRNPLPNTEKFSALLQKLGIDENSHVVIYDNKFGANSAARFWWMLRSAGFEKVQILDGGIQRAEQVGFPLYSEISTAKIADKISTIAWKCPITNLNEVETASNNQLFRIIDVREKERYDGQNEPIDLVAGHIPGAVNLPFKENLNVDGTFKNPEILKEHFLKIIGNKNPENIIVHCGSGVTACHTILAMDYAGLEIPKLYVGSWSEWSRNNKIIAKNI